MNALTTLSDTSDTPATPEQERRLSLLGPEGFSDGPVQTERDIGHYVKMAFVLDDATGLQAALRSLSEDYRMKYDRVIAMLSNVIATAPAKRALDISYLEERMRTEVAVLCENDVIVTEDQYQQLLEQSFLQTTAS